MRVADVRQLPREAQPVQVQRKVPPGGHNCMNARRQAGQQHRKLLDRISGAELVQVVDDQDEGVATGREFGQHPVHHGVTVEAAVTIVTCFSAA
jgi:hypothetical protein